jgi:phage shock protein A
MHSIFLSIATFFARFFLERIAELWDRRDVRQLALEAVRLQVDRRFATDETRLKDATNHLRNRLLALGVRESVRTVEALVERAVQREKVPEGGNRTFRSYVEKIRRDDDAYDSSTGE